MGWNHQLVVHEVWVCKIKDPLINLGSDQNLAYWNTVVGFEVGFKSTRNFRHKKNHSELNGKIWIALGKIHPYSVSARPIKVY